MWLLYFYWFLKTKPNIVSHCLCQMASRILGKCQECSLVSGFRSKRRTWCPSYQDSRTGVCPPAISGSLGIVFESNVFWKKTINIIRLGGLVGRAVASKTGCQQFKSCMQHIHFCEIKFSRIWNYLNWSLKNLYDHLIYLEWYIFATSSLILQILSNNLKISFLI